MKILILLLVLSSSVCSQKGSSADPGMDLVKDDSSAKVTYIANEGVLIESGEKKILIDGLHRFYKTPYAFPPDDLLNLLEGAHAPYDDIDLILVSHLHGDHFHPKSVALHLQNNAKTRLAASAQIIDEIRKGFGDYDEIQPQITKIPYDWKRSVSEDFNGIKVKYLGLRHGNERFQWIQNFGHLIEIGDKKFLHLGDADMIDENFSEFKLNEKGIDVAFIPYWFLLSESGRELVEEQFKPRNIVAVHVSLSEAESVSKKLNELYPEITVFTKILESKVF